MTTFFKRLARGVVTSALLVGLATAAHTAPAAASAPPPRPADSYAYATFTLWGTSLNLDINHANTTPGTQAIVWDAGNQANQKFWVLPVDNRWFYLQSVYDPALCLNVNHSSTKQGASIILWNCDAGALNELFALDDAANGFHLVARPSGMCLEPAGGIAAAHPVIQWPCHTDDDRAEEWWPTYY
jgi:hypothetical protein